MKVNYVLSVLGLALVANFAIGTGAEEPVINEKILDSHLEEYGSNGSTAAELERFEATSASLRIALEWETVTELYSEGFHIRRSMEGEDYLRVTPSLIPSTGGRLIGDIYSYVDYDVLPGVGYSYLLEKIDITGRSSYFGPVTAMASGLCGAATHTESGYGVLWIVAFIFPAIFLVLIGKRAWSGRMRDRLFGTLFDYLGNGGFLYEREREEAP